MTRVSRVIRGCLGWCPHVTPLPQPAPVQQSATLAEPAIAPVRGTGGIGRMVQGLRLVFASVMLLLGNLRLLWPCVFAGFILLYSGLPFNIGWMTLWTPFRGGVIDNLSVLVYGQGPALARPDLVSDAADVLEVAVFSFTFSLLLAFSLAFLLAALIYGIIAIWDDRQFVLREAISAAGMRARGLFQYAAVLAAAVTAVILLLNAVTWHVDTFMTPSGPGYSAYNAAAVTGLLPGMAPLELPVPAIRAVLIMLILLVTMFSVPVIMFEQRGIAGSIARSVSLLRQTWQETLLLLAIAGLVMAALAVTFEVPWADMPGAPSLVILLWVLAIPAAAVAAILLAVLYCVATTGQVPEKIEQLLTKDVPE